MIFKTNTPAKYVEDTTKIGFKEHAKKHELFLELGKIYTIETVNLMDAFTFLSFKEIPNEWFNSIHFEYDENQLKLDFQQAITDGPVFNNTDNKGEIQGKFVLDLDEPCWVIVKIQTKNGFKVGMVRDIFGLEEGEELLDPERYSEEEAEIKLTEWCARLGLEEFNFHVDKYLHEEVSKFN